MNAKLKLKKLTKAHALPLKKQYFASDIMEVKQFLIARGYEYDDYGRQVTASRKANKLEFLDKVKVKAEESMINDVADKRKIDTTELAQMKHTTVQLLKVKLNELNFRAQEWVKYIQWKRSTDPNKPKKWEGYAPQEVKSSEVIEIMNAIKRELGEPLTITKIHSSVDVNPNLTEDELEIIEMLDTMEALEVEK